MLFELDHRTWTQVLAKRSRNITFDSVWPGLKVGFVVWLLHDVVTRSDHPLIVELADTCYHSWKMDFIVKLSGTHSETSTKLFGRGISTLTSALCLGSVTEIIVRIENGDA